MHNIITIIKKSLATSSAVLLLVVFPTTSRAAFADDAPVCTPPSSNQAGVHWPTGSDASQFVYQCDGPYDGQWLSAHYVYNPADSSKTPLVAPVYTYNDATGLWDTQIWNYSPAKGSYMLNDASVQTPPAGAPTIGGPKPAPITNPAPTNGNSPSGTTGGSTNGNPSQTTGTQNIGNPGSNGTGNNLTINNGTTNTMNNGIVSFAGSGNALVNANTSGGSATSGDAAAIATIINMLQSSSNVLGDPNMLTFTANINGDVNGDLLLDPAKLSAVQPANTNSNLDNNVTVNNSADTAINNDVNLAAQSGDADVTRNTKAGDATTGNATAVANIVNILNSAVSAGQSFVGVVNINGNLNGDILLPADFVDTLLANNVPHSTVSTASLSGDYNLTNDTTSAINNDITTNANSGNATEYKNTKGGDATTGSAATNVTVFNLTGSEVVASNDLLVFVNVLGSWVGLIMNAPAGSTAAELGGGVTSNTQRPTNTTVTNKNNGTINNNVNVSAASGDANVAENTKAGNAKSGDASASVSLLNMINNSLSLNGWFGLLFINVYGNWNGSFGVNTAAGDPVATPTTATVGGVTLPVQTFGFIPNATKTSAKASTNQSGKASGNKSGTQADATTAQQSGAVLAAQTNKATGTAVTPQLASGHTSYALPVIGGILALLILGASERKRFTGRHSVKS